MRPIFFLIGVTVFLSCSGGEKQTDQHIYWVNSTKASCVEKKQDMKLRINDIWVADHIRGQALVMDTDGMTLPRLEINVGEMRYMGTDGCNNFNGGIIELDEHTIRFGIAAGTRMMCMDMKIPDLFNTTLPEAMSWEIKDKELHLYDADGNELMQLKKTD